MQIFSFEFSSSEINIDEISTSGQCFRWKKLSSRTYISPVNHYLLKVLILSKDKLKITLYSDMSDKDAKRFIQNYFNLNLNYKKIVQAIEFDQYVKIALEKSYGLRVLNQDLTETIFSFMLSQNNTVSNVSNCIERICKKVSLSNGFRLLEEDISKETYYPFPLIQDLANLTIKEYEKMKCGYRSIYLNRTAERLVKEEINLEKWKKLESGKLRSKLIEFNGIGEKVADCIMLYSFKKFEVVPMDTWVQKASIELYGLKKNCTNKDVRNFFLDRFGEYAGWAHLFIFNHARKKSKRNTPLKESFIS